MLRAFPSISPVPDVELMSDHGDQDENGIEELITT